MRTRRATTRALALLLLGMAGGCRSHSTSQGGASGDDVGADGGASSTDAGGDPAVSLPDAGQPRACAGSCGERLRCWDEDTAGQAQSAAEVEVHRSRLAVQSVSSEHPELASGWAANVLDGAAQTLWRSAERPGEAEELVLRLDGPRRVRAVTIQGSMDTSADVEVYVGVEPDCWGSPLGRSTLAAGSGIATLRLDGTGRVGRFVRLVVRSAVGASLAEVGVQTTAGFWTDLSRYAVQTLPYVQPLEADLPADPALPLTYALRAGPDGATVTASGTLQWTPQASLAPGRYAFEVTASAGSASVGRTFEVELLGRTVVASADLDPAAEDQLSVTGSGTALDGLTVTVPAGAGNHLEVWALSAPLDGAAEDFRPVGPGFVVVGATAPVRLEANEALRARALSGAGPTATLALATYELKADHAPKSAKLSVVGGECSGSSGGNGQERQDVLGKYAEPGALTQLLRHEGACYRLQRAPFTAYYWDNEALQNSVVQARLDGVLRAAERTRSAMTRPGCVALTEPLDLLVVPLDGVDGVAPMAGRQVLIRRGLSGTRARAVVHHELTHTVHQRTVLWANPAAYEVDRADERWAVEGLAVFNEDEVEDLDDWEAQYLNLTAEGYPALDRDTVSRGLRSRHMTHPYLQFTYFKALKARAGFDTCDYLSRRVGAASAYAAIDGLVGGTDERHREYAQFAATWLLPALVSKSGRIDDDDRLPDALPDMKSLTMVADQALPGCGNAGAAVEVPLGTLAGGTGLRFVCKVPPSAARKYRVQLVKPERHATLLAFDGSGKELGEAKPAEELRLPDGTTEFSIAVALHQGPAEAGLGEPQEVRVRVDSGELSYALQPVTDTESRTDETHPALLERGDGQLRARYFNASMGPAGWPDAGFYEADYPDGVQVGNLDWRGERGDVLSWKGPHGRSAPTVAWRSGYSLPTNLTPDYVGVTSDAAAHRGTAVFAQGKVLFDFAGKGYVSGAALRYRVEPTTGEEKRYLLAVTTSYHEPVDRLWSVDLAAEPRSAVALGVIELPGGRAFDPGRRVNSYFFNASATRCSSVCPVLSKFSTETVAEESRTEDGETTSSGDTYEGTVTIASQLVCHVSWSSPFQAAVSFESEVVGDETFESTFAFTASELPTSLETSHLRYEASSRSGVTVTDVPIAIDYQGDQEVRLTASLDQSSTRTHVDHNQYQGISTASTYSEEIHETKSVTTFVGDGFLLRSSVSVVSTTHGEDANAWVDRTVTTDSTERRLVFADLRYGTYGFFTEERKVSGTYGGNIMVWDWGVGTIPGTSATSIAYALQLGGQPVGSGSAEMDESLGSTVGWHSLYMHTQYYDTYVAAHSERRVTSGRKRTVTVNTGVALPVNPAGFVQLLPEVAIQSHSSHLHAIEFPDLGTYDFARGEFDPALKQFFEVSGAGDPAGLLGVHGPHLRLTRVGLF